MKKFFKGLAVLSLVALIVVVGAAAYVIHKLPSSQKVSKSLFSSKPSVVNEYVKNSESGSAAPATVATVSTEAAVPQATAVATPPKLTAEQEKIQQAILEDFLSEDRPLSNFCGSLKNSALGSMTGTEFNKSFSKLEVEKSDPRVQAAKPLLRYVFRLPKMQQLVSDVSIAKDKVEDDDFLDKAQFYAAALAAFTEMKSHQEDLESILDRGYLFIGLNNLIASKPELLNDPRVQGFCSRTEEAFNTKVPVDYEEEKKSFLNVVQDAGMQPADIGFDINYKSEIDFQLSEGSLTLKGGWLEDLIRSDSPAQ